MENNQQSFWQFSDQLRLQSTNFANLSINDTVWGNTFTAKRPEERRNFDIRVGGERNNSNSSSNNTHYPKQKVPDFNGFNSYDGWKIGTSFEEVLAGSAATAQKNNTVLNGVFNKGIYSKPSYSNIKNTKINKNDDDHEIKGRKKNNSSNGSSSNNNNNNKNDNKSGSDKRFKTLPPSESLPRNEAVGGYIFVCNNDTMEENLKRQLFGLPPRYRDSVRAITPGLPLFLYNYSTHQLHGIFEAASFGGTNIDPMAWEDKKCPGESRFPAQVRAITRKICEPLEEDSFRPVLHHYDGPKFRLELNIPEAIALLDIFAENNTVILQE